MPTELTIESAKSRIAQLSNQRDYWRRIALSRNSEASRKAIWRAKNPKRYILELRRNRMYSSARVRRIRLILVVCMAVQIHLAKHRQTKRHLQSVSHT